MIVKLLNSKDSKQIADYNGRKLKAMNARIVCESCPNALKMIRKYESSDFLTAKARNLGVQLAISPGKKDKTDGLLIKQFCQKLMHKLEMEDQPWVLIEHTDIVRAHYHLFSTRAREDGTVCSSAYLKYRVYTAVKEVCEEMNIPFGVSEDMDFPSIKKYEKSTGYITVQYKALLDKVLEETPTSWQEFQDKMLSRNVKVTKGKKNPHLIFMGLGADGKPDVAPVYNLDKDGALLDKVERCISEAKNGVSTKPLNEKIEASSFQTVEQPIIHPTMAKDVDQSSVIPQVILNPSEKTFEPEIPAASAESEAPRPETTAERPSRFRIMSNTSTITEPISNDEEPEEPVQTLPEEQDDYEETFPIPTAESVAKIIRQRLREANNWQDLDRKLQSDYIIISPQHNSYDNTWTLDVSALDLNSGKFIDFPDRKIMSLLTLGEVRLLRDEHEWSYYEENLTGERDLLLRSRKKYHR